MIYPTVDDIIDANKLALELHKDTRAEHFELIKTELAIYNMIVRIKRSHGDVIKKASRFLKEINKGHFFGSANKRTSTIVAFSFIWENWHWTPLKKKTKENLDFLMGIREGRHDVEDIELWLKKRDGKWQ